MYPEGPPPPIPPPNYLTPLFPWRGRMSESLFRRSIDMAMDAGGGTLYLSADFTISQDCPAGGQAGGGGERPSEGEPESELFTVHVDEKKRTISGVASVLGVSRTGVQVSIQGLDLSHFKKNPIALASHLKFAPDGFPTVIATIAGVTKGNKNTVLRFRGMEFDTDPLSDAWFQKISRGFVRMVSIGILPTEIEVGTMVVGKGEKKREILFLDILESQLLEISPVAIGANTGAFIGESSASLRLASKVANQALAIERLEKALDSTRGIVLDSRKNRLRETLDRIGRLQSSSC